MSLYKCYEKLENGQEIKMSISFNRETRNWATSEPTKIGYRVSVTPVKRRDCGNGIVMEETGAFTGFNDTLIECSRQGSRRLEMAIDELNQRKERYLNQFREGGRYAIK